jgi:hypothetical protein
MDSFSRLFRSVNIAGLFVVCLLVAAPYICTGQDLNRTMYVFKDRYNEQGKRYIEANLFFKEIKLLGGYMIDPAKKGVINLESVSGHLERLYPDPNTMGILCINLENSLYKNIKNYSSTNAEFKYSVAEFNKLLKYIRSQRPNLKIGIYGIPYRTYYASQKKWNKGNKLDELLSNTDVIFPSLYILFPDKQNGSESNREYLKQNLDTAFEYGSRLGKPVLPFIWYMVNPGNKKYGGELLSLAEMERYLQFIYSYSNFNQRVDGVVWWESSDSSFHKYAKVSSGLQRGEMILDKNWLIRKYTENLEILKPVVHDY